MLTSRSQKRAIPKMLSSSSSIMLRFCQTGQMVLSTYQPTPMLSVLVLLIRSVVMLPLLPQLP